jgi:hypothetical protein
MPYDPAIHYRRSIRLKGYDYWLTPIFNSQEGICFVTICCMEKICRFGGLRVILNQVQDAMTDGEIALNIK